MTDLVYLYAILTAPPPDADIFGIDDRQLRWIGEGRLCAAVGDVPAAEFEEGPLNEGIKDMNWLGPRAIAHQEVNHRLHEVAEAVIPLSFGSVFRNDDPVRGLLREQAVALHGRLDAVRGRSEWVVAVHRIGEPEPEALDEVSAAVRLLRAEVAAASPGRAHLLKRRLAELERDEVQRLDRHVVAEILREIEPVVDGLFREPLPSDTLDRPVLRCSLLVPSAGESQLMELVERQQRRWQHGYQLQLTGPWPPYRFAGLEADARHVAAH